MLAAAARSLFRRRSFTLAAAGTLAIGIAAPTALFSTVNAALLKPLPYAHAEDIYTVRTFFPSGRFTIGLVASEELAALDDYTDAVVVTAGATRTDGTLSTDFDTRQVVGYAVSEHFFDLLGVPMALGRSFTPAEHARSAPKSVILSNRLWTRAFGGRADIVGTTVMIAGFPVRVVGVARPDFNAPAGADLWLNSYVPIGIGHGYEGYVRLRPGVTPDALQGRMTQAMAALGKKYPDQDNGRAFRLRPLLEETVGDLRPILLILFGATALLLLLATVNVTNLMLAGSTGRSREMAVRAALGAGKGRIVVQLMAESVLLACAGGLAGLAAAYTGVHLLMRLGGARLPRLDAVSFDWHVVGFAAALVAITGVLVGVVPALRLADGDIASLMNEGSRSVRGSQKTQRLLGAFVIAEIAVAVALVGGAGRLLASFEHLQQIDPGFDPRGRLVLDVMLPPQRYASQQRLDAWWRAVESRLRDAGAAHVAMASALPLQHEWDNTTFTDIVSKPDIPPDQRPNGRMRNVSADFFSTMGIRIVAGRAFTAQDGPAAPAVAIVNEAFVRRSLNDVDPLRERLKGFSFRMIDGRPVEQLVAIVGVAADVRYSALTAAPEPVVYIPSAQGLALRQSIVVTTRDGRPETRVPQWRAALTDVDPGVAIEVGSLSALVSSSLERQRVGMWLMSGFGAAALLLAMVGVFGVIAYVVAQRRGEMAVRQALGATRPQVFWMVVRDGGRLAVVGLGIGIALTWWTGHLIARYVYDVRPGDPGVLAGSAGAVAVIAIAATLLPARRAARSELARTLRQA